jgi:acetyltransferase-like isoleucine patch superfamily enzyme
MGIGRIIQKLKLRYGSQETVLKTLRQMGMRIGEGCRFYSLKIGSEPWLIRLGDQVCVTPDVSFVTHCANTQFQDKYESLTAFGKIDIKHHCFIGVGAILLPNVTIGPYSVVGAGSVVSKDVPPNTVVAGNPARVICSIEEYEKKCVARHIEIPLDREAAREVLEKHFWGDDA